MSDQTYENRKIETRVVKSADEHSVTGEDGWGFGFGAFKDEVRPALAAILQPGVTFEFETKGFSQITGIRLPGGPWIDRKSDQDLEEAHRQFVENLHAQHAAQLAAHGDEWQEREDALPDWIRERLVGFHKTGGLNFEQEGWAYELIVAELAVLYAEHPESLDLDYEGEHESIHEFAHKHGTSGNQHGIAKLLARVHVQKESVTGIPSALTPLTGDKDYSGGK